jgi:outer membrane protein assembly factor BamE
MHHLHPLCSQRADERRPLPRRSALTMSLAALCTAFVLSACSSVSGVANLVTPYKIDIQQGNVVTREQAQVLQPGMSRVQVRDVLGSPLLTSVFHADRWDYVFTFRRQGQAPQQRQLVVFFKGDVLERFEADELPTEAEFVASLDVRRKAAKEPVLQATEAQLKAFQEKNQAPAGAAAAAEPPVAVPRSYPPLEVPGATR